MVRPEIERLHCRTARARERRPPRRARFGADRRRRGVQVPGRIAADVRVAVPPEDPAGRERDHLDRVLILLVGDDPVLGAGPKTVSSSNRNGIPGVRFGHPHKNSLRSVHKEHPVVAPIGSKQVPVEGARQNRLRGPRPGRHCRSRRDGVGLPGRPVPRACRSRPPRSRRTPRATRRRLLRTARTRARRARRSVAATRDVVAVTPVGTAWNPRFVSVAACAPVCGAIPRTDSPHPPWLTSSRDPIRRRQPQCLPAPRSYIDTQQLRSSPALIAPRDREAEEAHRLPSSRSRGG